MDQNLLTELPLLKSPLYALDVIQNARYIYKSLPTGSACISQHHH